MNEIMKFEKDKPIPAEQVELIKKTVAKDASDNELAMYLYLAKQYELDPFLKEICFIKRKIWNEYKGGYDEVPTIMTTRDGFLSIAHRSKMFNGMETRAIYHQDSKELLGAECIVYRKDMEHPITVSVDFKEYCVYNNKTKQPQALWASKPVTMIKKVAESQALRKAFNIHGIYAEEELQAEIKNDAKQEIEYAQDTLIQAEKFYSNEDEYEKWAIEFKCHAIDFLESAKTTQEISAWEKANEASIGILNEEDREYIRISIESNVQRIITGAPKAEEIVETLNADGKKAFKEGKISMQEKEVIDDKSWMTVQIKIIYGCKVISDLQKWLKENAYTLKHLSAEHRNGMEAYYKAQWDKLRGSESAKYNWV